MVGKALRTNFGTDANDIPKREAFEWYAADTGRGMALWYKGSGPWWDSTSLKPFDGVSLEEERKDPGSLWHFYKSLLAIRNAEPALVSGRYVPLANSNDSVFTFLRTLGKDTVLVAVNLSAGAQKATTAWPGTPSRHHPRQLFGDATEAAGEDTLMLNLPPYGAGVWIK
jgi:glycosidase